MCETWVLILPKFDIIEGNFLQIYIIHPTNGSLRLVVCKTWFYLFQRAKLRPTGVRGHSLRTNYDIFVCPTPDLKYDRMFGWVWYYTSLEKSVWYYMYDTICGWQIFGKSGSMIQYVGYNMYYLCTVLWLSVTHSVHVWRCESYANSCEISL